MDGKKYNKQSFSFVWMIHGCLVEQKVVSYHQARAKKANASDKWTFCESVKGIVTMGMQLINFILGCFRSVAAHQKSYVCLGSGTETKTQLNRVKCHKSSGCVLEKLEGKYVKTGEKQKEKKMTAKLIFIMWKKACKKSWLQFVRRQKRWTQFIVISAFFSHSLLPLTLLLSASNARMIVLRSRARREREKFWWVFIYSLVWKRVACLRCEFMKFKTTECYNMRGRYDMLKKASPKKNLLLKMAFLHKSVNY